jgi:hypothetical protein
MPKQIGTTTMEGTRNRGRPGERRRDEVEEDLHIMRIRNRETIARDSRE